MTAATSMEGWVKALGLPAGAMIERRVPKSLLIEHGASAGGDRKAIAEGIDSLHWIASLKPATTGVKAYADDIRDYVEIAVLAVRFRPKARTPRLTEVIHRAIPYPLLLLAEAEAGVQLSVSPKRKALNEAGKVVPEELVMTAPLPVDPKDDVERAFRDSLDLAGLPAADLLVLYDGWRARIEALAAAALTGRYDLPGSAELAERRRQALDDHERLSKEAHSLRQKAGQEKQMNRRVELNLEIRRLENAASEALDNL